VTLTSDQIAGCNCERQRQWRFRTFLGFLALMSLPGSLTTAAPGKLDDIIPKGSLPNLTALESCTEGAPLATATVQTKGGPQTAVITLHSARLRQWTVHQVTPGEVASFACDSAVSEDALLLTRTGQLWKGRPGQLKRQMDVKLTGVRPLLARWFTYARERGCLIREWTITGFATPQNCPPEKEMRSHLLLVSTNGDKVRPQTFFQVLDGQGRQVWQLTLRDVKASQILTSLSLQGEFQVLATAGSQPGSPAIGQHDVVLLEIAPAQGTLKVLLRVGSTAEEEATLFGFNADQEVVVGGQTNGAVKGRYGGRGDAFLTQQRSKNNWTMQLKTAKAERFDALFLTGSFYDPLQGLIFGQIDGRPAIWRFKTGTDRLMPVSLPANYPEKELKFFRIFNENALLVVGARGGRTAWSILPLNR
jgi:hypothetical protein